MLLWLSSNLNSTSRMLEAEAGELEQIGIPVSSLNLQQPLLIEIAVCLCPLFFLLSAFSRGEHLKPKLNSGRQANWRFMCPFCGCLFVSGTGEACCNKHVILGHLVRRLSVGRMVWTDLNYDPFHSSLSV